MTDPTRPAAADDAPWPPGGRTAARQHSLREINLGHVLRAILDAADPPSRAAVAATTGLTRATVSTLVDQLVEARLVRELPPATPQRAGRPAVPLVPAARAVVGLGLEVNVDYLGGRVVDFAGDVVAEHVEPGAFHDSDPRVVLARLGAIARDLVAQVEGEGMVVAGARLALPGLVDTRAGRLQVAPNLGWSDVEPLPLLGLDDVDVEVANEAKLAGLAQTEMPAAMTGALRRPEGAAGDPAPVPSSFLYVSGDVGIGAAIVVDRAPFLGAHGWSGEIGHVVVDPAGPRCSCGATGCLERYAGKESVLVAAGLAHDAPLADLLEALETGDAAALDATHRAGRALGSALADFVNLVDIGTVLLGGTFTQLLPYVREDVLAVLAERVLAARWAGLEVRAPAIGHRAAMTGGARQVLREVLDAPAGWTARRVEAVG